MNIFYKIKEMPLLISKALYNAIVAVYTAMTCAHLDIKVSTSHCYIK